MIKVGTKVRCRLFNWPDGKFYGDFFDGEAVEVRSENEAIQAQGWPYPKRYLVDSADRNFPLWLTRKEIIKELKNGTR